MLDLRWKSAIGYEVSVFKKCRLTSQLPSFSSHDSLPFLNILNVRNEAGLSLELDPRQGGSAVVMTKRPKGMFLPGWLKQRSAHRPAGVCLPGCTGPGEAGGQNRGQKRQCRCIRQEARVDQEEVWNYGRLKISNFGWFPTRAVACFNVWIRTCL